MMNETETWHAVTLKTALKENAKNIIKCWDLWTAIAISIVVVTTAGIWIADNIPTIIDTFTPIAIAVETVAVGFSIAGLVLFVSFHRNDEFGESIIKAKSLGGFLISARWTIVIAVSGIATSAILGIILRPITIHLSLTVLAITFFLFIYTLFLFASMCEGVAKYGMLKMIIYNDEDEMREGEEDGDEDGDGDGSGGGGGEKEEKTELNSLD